jgi:hypothetical protein
VIRDELYKAAVQKVLEAESSLHEGAHLAEVRFLRASQRTEIVAIYRTPTPFTPSETAALEARLPPRSGQQAPTPRIRSVPVVVTSKDGYLYSSADMAEFVGAPVR